MFPSAVPRPPVCPGRRSHQRQPVLHQLRPAQQRHHPLPGNSVQKALGLHLCCCFSSSGCNQTVVVAAWWLAGSPQAAEPLRRQSTEFLHKTHYSFGSWKRFYIITLTLRMAVLKYLRSKCCFPSQSSWRLWSAKKVMDFWNEPNSSWQRGS